MAKRPTIDTLVTGPSQKNALNKNFRAIVEAFDNVLHREGAIPNFMQTDLDVADANVTNVNVMAVEVLVLDNQNFTGFAGERYVEKLAALECPTGAVLTHDADGDPTCLDPGDNGQVLKTRNSYLAWEEDLDTDTDTVGVTIQEDGVTVAENVTTINFLWSGSTLVSTPAGNQVDLEMSDLIGPLFEDTDQLDSNLDPEADGLWSTPGEVTRVDLSSLTGVTLPLSGTELTVVAEASNYFEDSVSGGASSGAWLLDVRFYEDDGTATPLTGTEIIQGGTLVNGGTAGGNLLTLVQNIPANTKYVDFGWALTPTFPLFLTLTNFSDRYRAIIPQSQNGSFATPNGHTTQGVRASTSPTS